MTREQIINKIMDKSGMLGRSIEDIQLVPCMQIQTPAEMYDHGYIRGIAWALYCTGILSYEEKEILNGNAVGEGE